MILEADMSELIKTNLGRHFGHFKASKLIKQQDLIRHFF